MPAGHRARRSATDSRHPVRGLHSPGERRSRPRCGHRAPGATRQRDPAEPRDPRPRDACHAPLPDPRARRALLPPVEISERYDLPLIYTACRTCYSELTPEDIFERATDGRVATERQQDLVRRVIESGHGSTIEHIVFTFAISGVTRTLSHQLVRHRAGLAFDQQSQRYVDYKEPSYMVPGSLSDAPGEIRER